MYEGAYLQECTCVWTLACTFASFVCMPVALGVFQFLFDICSSPPMEQVSQESTTCSLAETRAKEPPTDANTRTRTHIYTSCTCSLVRRYMRPRRETVSLGEKVRGKKESGKISG